MAFTISAGLLENSRSMHVNCDFLPSIDCELMMAARECSDGENLMKFSVTRPSFHTALFIEFQWGNLIIHSLSQPRWSSDDSMIQFLNIITSWRNSIPSLTSLSFTFMIFQYWLKFFLLFSAANRTSRTQFEPSVVRVVYAASAYCHWMKFSNLILCRLQHNIQRVSRMKLWKNKN